MPGSGADAVTGHVAECGGIKLGCNGIIILRMDPFNGPLCLDRIAPPRRDAPISISLPPVASAADAVVASSALLDAVAAGEVTPGEAGPVMALLVAHKGIVETGDLERRITALEEKGTKR